MPLFFKAVVFLLTMIVTPSVLAQTSPSSLLLSEQAQAQFTKNTGLEIQSIAQSPLPNMLQITTRAGILYLSQDGKHVFAGNLFTLENGMRNETELAMSELRLQSMSAVTDSAVVFKAENEKYVIDVFTDITCGYCRKFHREIEDYLALGITVRYFAFPRAGLNSQPYRDMVSIWCAKDQQQAMTQAKSGETVDEERCVTKVAEHYRIGQQIGVNGTPNIVLSNGSLIGGYVPAASIINQIKQKLAI